MRLGLGLGLATHRRLSGLATPAQVASAVAWWSASAGVTQVAGAVSAWVDQIGALNAVQATGALQPTYSATGFNSTEPGVTSDGSQYLQSVGIGNLPIGDTDHECWVRFVDAANPADGDTSRPAFGWGGSGSVSRDVRRTVVSGTSRMRAAFGNDVATDASVNALGKHYARSRRATTVGAISVDGGAETTAVLTTLATTSVQARIFNNASVTVTGWVGAISDIAVFATGQLTGADLTNMQAFFGR